MFLRFLLFFLIFFKRFYEFSLLNIAIIALVFLYVPMIFRIFFPRFVFLSLQFPAVYARILRRRRLLFDIYIVTIAALLLERSLWLYYFVFQPDVACKTSPLCVKDGYSRVMCGVFLVSEFVGFVMFAFP